MRGSRATRAFRIWLALLVAALVLPSVPTALAAPTAAQLASQISELEGELAAAGREYDTAYWRQQESELRLGRLEDSLVQTEKELAFAEANLSARVRLMYRRGGDDDVLSFILGSTSFEEMASRLELMERVALQDADIIEETTKLREAYEIEVAAVSRERDRLASSAAVLRDKRDALESQLSGKKKQYADLQAALQSAIQAEAKRNRVTYTPPASANGMTFPVAGAHYYSDTWGASRSGGRRRHKGTDIMASRGTAVVATLPGTVRASTSSLGGKTIWLTASNGWQFYYAHLDSWSVTSGSVSQGQVIGTVGSTGNASASAPHLHFEIHPNGGSAVNPYPYLRAMQGR